jgi:hypothetical protein
MQANFNYSRLFNQTTDKTSQSFIPKINIATERENLLKRLAKKTVDGLKVAFKDLPSYLPDGYLESLSERDRHTLIQLTPKFRVQGSFSYATVNDPVPQYTPPQEVDIDIGCYIPLQYAEANPALAHTLLFEVIDGVLTKIASQNSGWKAVCDKNTCGRLNTTEGAHIDVVAYATPEAEFKKLTERSEMMLAALSESKSYNLDEESVDFFKKELLHFDKVNMAHRTEGWKESDPKLVTDWFQEQCKNKKHLRKISKILKAWRDFTWKDGQGPSSISLMVMASHIFGQHNEPECLMDALILTTSNLVGLMQQDQYLPVAPHDKVWPRSGDEKHKAVTIDALINLNAVLTSCKYTETDRKVITNKLIANFGDRLPNRPDWISEISKGKTKHKHPPISTPPTQRPNTTAG